MKIHGNNIYCYYYYYMIKYPNLRLKTAMVGQAWIGSHFVGGL